MAKFKMAQVVYDLIYPVGSIYITMNGTNPGTLFGGTWTRLSGGFLYATSGTPNKTVQGSGGTTTGSWSGTSGSWSGTSGSTTLSLNQIPSHNHGSAGNHSHGVYLNRDTTFPFIGNPGWTGGSWNNAAKLSCGSGSYSGFHFGTNDAGAHTHTSQGGGQGHTHSIPSHTHSIPSHSHSLSRFDVAVWYRTA